MKGLVLLCVLLVAGCTSPPPTGPIESLDLHIVGESIAGPTFSKTIALGQTTDGYLVNYRCTETDPRLGPICPCGHVEYHLGISAVESIVQRIESIQDQGENATCCDHPYTTIGLKYSEGGTRSITVGVEETNNLKVEDLFSVQC